MLAVHWAPVNSTKNILKNGISKSRNGVYCFPLTGLKSLDRWWIYFFNQCGARQRKKYNGFVFRLKQEDMPAYFGHWIGARSIDVFKKSISDLKELQSEYRCLLLIRLGEEIARLSNISYESYDYEKQQELFLNLAAFEIRKSPRSFTGRRADNNFMTSALEDHQIVLSNSIPPQRILKVLPQGDEFGKVLRTKKRNEYKLGMYSI